MPLEEPISLKASGCCPDLQPCNSCDRIDIRYRLPFRPAIETEDAQQVVPVEVTLRFQLERCSGPLTLGDLLYTTTLLPGEQVRLATSDRQSRFSYDSQSQLASRQYTTSEESFYLAGMANATSDLTVLSGSSQSSDFHNSATSGGGSAGLDLGIFSIGGSVSAASYDAHSASAFAGFLSQHAQSSSHHVEAGVRAASSTSVFEVSSRSHAAGESEDQYESASRTFSNANRCHALTFLFYRIDKCQTVKFTLAGIDRRVDDPAAPTGVELNPPPPPRNVAIIPDAVLGASASRPQVAQQVNAAIPAEAATLRAAVGELRPQLRAAKAAIPPGIRAAALAAVDADLRAAGLIDDNGAVTEQAQQTLGWEHDLRLPTPGVIVKGCLDECSTCEPGLKRQIELELTRKDLENQLLKRQIELLDQAQQYRCCPDSDGGAAEPASHPA
jgi:hypothetical protein